MFKYIKQWMDNSIVDELLYIIILLVIVETIAQNSLKNGSNNSTLFFIGLLFYVIIGYLLHYAYHNFPLSKVNVIWSSCSIIIAAMLGYILYDEPYSTKSVFAILFALLAVLLSYQK